MAKQEFSGNTYLSFENIKRRLLEVGINPNEAIGQHFLVNKGVIDFLAQSVNPGAQVIEVGCGTGNVTQELAKRSSRVFGIEIDRRYESLLTGVIDEYGNVTVSYADVLRTDFGQFIKGGEETQIIANLPFSITEPFVSKIASLKISSATLVVGRRYAESIVVSSNPDSFGRLGILTSTFFDVEELATLTRDCFYPQPRTESSIVQLRPRDPMEMGNSRRDVLFRHLFLSTRQNSTLRKGLKEGMDEFELFRDMRGLSKKDSNRKSRLNTRLRLKNMLGIVDHFGLQDITECNKNSVSVISKRAIDGLGLPDSVLDKPFSLLNNSELRMLYVALDR